MTLLLSGVQVELYGVLELTLKATLNVNAPFVNTHALALFLLVALSVSSVEGTRDVNWAGSLLCSSGRGAGQRVGDFVDFGGQVVECGGEFSRLDRGFFGLFTEP